MTIKLHRKEAGADFEARVEAFRQARIAHQKTTGKPAPVEHPMIEAALKRVHRDDKPEDFVSDFEVIEATLEEKKKDLDAELHKARDSALSAKMSSARRGTFVFQMVDVLAVKPENRTDEDKEIIIKQKKLQDHQIKIYRHAAKLHAQIEDLTEATIDAWKPEPFPE